MSRRENRKIFARFSDIRDPQQCVGLWSHHEFRETAIYPVGRTRETINRYLQDDVQRHLTFADARAAMLAKDDETDAEGRPRKTAAQKLREYAEEFKRLGAGKIPAWFFPWRRYARRLENTRTVRESSAVRLSFDAPALGLCAHEGNLHVGRMFFLRRKHQHNRQHPITSYYVAVVLKPGGTKWWDQIGKTNVTWTDNVYDRLMIDPRGGYSWGPIYAEVVNARVEAKEMCLFRLDSDALFQAVTDPTLNPFGKWASLSCDFDFFVRDPNAAVREYYLSWAVTFNPSRGKYVSCDKSRIGVLEIMQERKSEWAQHPIEVEVDKIGQNVSLNEYMMSLARRVVRENGCLVLPADASDELRYAAMYALFFVTYPERRPDTPGGLLCGYQLPGRMVAHAQQQDVRFTPGKAFGDLRRKQAVDQLVARRAIVVDTLLSRAARVLSSRNGMSEDDARRRIESVGGRDILECAATRWGMMDGNALKLFKPKPMAGALKLPDLSLALGFELRLGLEGGGAGIARLVQTAKIRTLDESAGATRESISGKYVLHQMWSPMPGREHADVRPRPNAMRILHDETVWYLLALPRHEHVSYRQDLLATDSRSSNSKSRITIPAYHFESASKSRTRQDLSLVGEQLDWNRVIKLAQEGRVYLWRIDFGGDQWLADIAFSTANTAPCRIVASAMEIDVRSSPQISLSLCFIVNSHLSRNYTRSGVRAWQSYCQAYPEERSRAQIVWEGMSSVASVVERDGVLIVPREQVDEAMRAMTYVVMPGRLPDEPGGAYNGYSLRDRAFVLSASSDSGGRERSSTSGSRSPNSEPRTLARHLGPRAPEFERRFVEMIERDPLSDKKSASYFKLEKPIVVTPGSVAAAVSREFNRIVHTGTMDAKRQMIRPSHEVAIGLWLSRLGDARV